MKVHALTVGIINTNCYILESNTELIVIDPGGDPDLIFNIIQKINKPVKYIINTHFHFDHNIGNLELKNKTGADIVIHEKEKPYIGFPVDQYIQAGDELVFGKEKLEVIETPGHTEGGICLLGKNEIFTGDTLFQGTYGRTDLPGGDEEKMQASLKKLAGIIKPGMTVYPGHGRMYSE